MLPAWHIDKHGTVHGVAHHKNMEEINGGPHRNELIATTEHLIEPLARVKEAA
jgi:hypothetical protein